MALEKPTKPTELVPRSFGGIKNNFDNNLQNTGFEPNIPQTYNGDNLNYQIDATGKELDYVEKIADFINEAPINHVPFVNENNQLDYLDKESLGGSGIEIGDIGFTQMAIDETKGKRRILNGSIIIQDHFKKFVSIIKKTLELNPDIACTEEEWQAEIKMSTAGICYKFVIDDVGGTIRLPKYPDYFIGGGKAPVVGNGLTLGWEDGTQNFGTVNWALLDSTGRGLCSAKNYGGTVGEAGTATAISPYNTLAGITTDPEKSGIEAQLDSAELIKGTYFIQVATGAETEDNIVNTLELNNPFVLLESKYFENEIYNISWLLANGSYNGSNAVHPSAYQALLVENNTEIAIGSTVTLPVGTDYTKRGLSVKLSTDSDITDYDFVVNTSDETFRLPIKVNLASSKAVVGNGMTLGLTNGTDNFGLLQHNGASSGGYQVLAQAKEYGKTVGTTGTLDGGTTKLLTGVTTDPEKSGLELSDSNLYLYFYVGETVQNANLVNVGRVEEKLANLIPNNSELISSYGLPDLTSGVEKSIDGFTAEMNGVLLVDYTGSRTCTVFVNGIQMFNQTMTYGTGAISTMIPLSKGDVVTQTNNGNFTKYTFTFYPLKGVN